MKIQYIISRKQIQDVLFFFPAKKTERRTKNSVESNVTDEVTVELDKIVKATKSKKDVGIRYMKSWERERELKEEGREEGREEERANTEAERKRADKEKERADTAIAELARYRAKFGNI